MDCFPGDRVPPQVIARVLAPLRCRPRPPPRELESGAPQASITAGERAVRRHPIGLTHCSNVFEVGTWRCRGSVSPLPRALRRSGKEEFMQEGDVSADRRRVQEDEYFRRRDQELIERQQRLAEAATERRLIAQAIGVDHDEIVLDLQMAGYSADTIVLVELAPSVQVAWADGRVSTHERELLLQIAAREHVAQNSPAHVQLDMWLSRPPSDHLFGTSLRALRDTLDSLQPDVRASLRRKLISDCAAIATASGGLLSRGHYMSNEEQRVIERIVGELS